MTDSYSDKQERVINKECQWLSAPLGIFLCIALYVPFVFVPFANGADVNSVFPAAKFITFIYVVLGFAAALTSRFYFRMRDPQITNKAGTKNIAIYLMVQSFMAAPFMSVLIWVAFDSFLNFTGWFV